METNIYRGGNYLIVCGSFGCFFLDSLFFYLFQVKSYVIFPPSKFVGYWKN